MIAMILLAVSCAKESDAPEQSPDPVIPQEIVPSSSEGFTYTLTGILSDKTKALISDEGVFSWSSEDKIAVLATSGRIYQFDCTDEQEGVFEFTGEEGLEFTKAWYPRSMVKSEGVISYPGQWSCEDLNPAKYFPMEATVSEGIMQFYHLGGLLKLTINDVPPSVTNLTLSSPDVALSGDMEITSLGLNDGRVDATGESLGNGGEIPVTPTKGTAEINGVQGDGTVSISLNLEETQAVTVYVPLPCGSYNFNIALNVGTEEVFSQSTSSAKNIGRADLVKMPALNPWSLQASYGNTAVAFYPSSVEGWYVAHNLPKDQDILIIDSKTGTQYGTRFATKKHVGYLCQCYSSTTSEAFPLKEASDLYYAPKKNCIFPVAPGTAVTSETIPAEYEVAHYELRGDFAGTLSEYTSAGIFSKTSDSPANGGNWSWYVVRNVQCTGTPIAFKLYGTAYVADDGVLETATTTAQSVGVARSLARPVPGSTYSIRYNVTPGMIYDIYLCEDLTKVIVCEAGSQISSMDSDNLKSLSNYGLYNYNSASYIYTPGVDQTWTETASFAIVSGTTFNTVQMAGLTNVAEGITVDVKVTVDDSAEETVSATVIQKEGNKAWLLSSDGTGMIVNVQ